MAIEQDYSQQLDTAALEVEINSVHLAKTVTGNRFLMRVLCGGDGVVLSFTMDDAKDLRDAMDMIAQQIPGVFDG